MGKVPADGQANLIYQTGGLLTVLDKDRLIGGAVIAYQSEDVLMLEGRRNMIAIFDIRVHPSNRRMGIGRLLFAEANRWAKSRRCTSMKIETQDVNVSACRFYAAMGCELGAINRRVYPSLPEETQLLWYKKL
jgi:GNAT superfamily N-acetyltransferase